MSPRLLFSPTLPDESPKLEGLLLATSYKLSAPLPLLSIATGIPPKALAADQISVTILYPRERMLNIFPNIMNFRDK